MKGITTLSLLLFTSFIFLYSCTKESSFELNNNREEVLPIPLPPSAYSGTACDTATEYMRALIDGVPFCFTQFYDSGADTFMNVYMQDGQLDQINMIRNNTAADWSLQIFINGANLLNKKLPYSLPAATANTGERAELQIRDLKRNLSCVFCADDSTNYVNTTYSGVRITISDTAQQTFSGTFEGEVQTKTGRKLNISKGEFRLKMIYSR